MKSSDKLRFFWDFFGPRATGTAMHFVHHLEEFLKKNELSLPVGTESVSDAHVTVFCDPPDVPRALLMDPDSTPEGETVADRVGRALRPQRVELRP